VQFIPVNELNVQYVYWMSVLNTFMIVMWTFIIPFLVIGLISLTTDYSFSDTTLNYYMFSFMVVGLITTFIFPRKIFNKEWLSTKYPSWNASLLNLSKRFISFGVLGNYKNLIVQKKHLYSLDDYDLYIIPNFSNVEMKYELKGDFVDKILSIDIIDNNKLSKLNKIQDNWYAIFKFKKGINEGEMVLNYM